MNIEQLNDQKQEELIEHLHEAGVNTIRLPMVNDRHVRFITRAYENGTGTVVILSPLQGSTGPLRPVDPSVGLTWRQQTLSDANPEEFRKWLIPQFAALEESGVRLSALELGNEINTPVYNGNFLPAQATGRML